MGRLWNFNKQELIHSKVSERHWKGFCSIRKKEIVILLICFPLTISLSNNSICYTSFWLLKYGKVKCELRTESYEFRYMSYEFKSMSYEIKSTTYEIKSTGYKFKCTSYELKFMSYKLKCTKLKARVARLKARIGKLKARVRRWKARVEVIKLWA